MWEPEGGEFSTFKTKENGPSSLMDFDLDLDASWPFDPNPFVSNPTSPFLLSVLSSPSSNPNNLPPFSPLWGFPDAADEKSGDNNTLPLAGIFDGSDFLSCNSDPINGDSREKEAERRMIPVVMPPAATEENSDVSCIIKERMTKALRYFKESTEQQVLVQVWAPVKNGGRYVLTTSGQPFVLDPHSSDLLQFRTVSVMYLFSADGGGDGDLGLPGRVFRQKLPEWTPNVQYYSSKEYPRLNHALLYNVRGALGLPVFEPSRQSCVGVVELIMTAQKINYACEVDKVCKALEAVNLKSYEVLDHPNMQICNEGRQSAFAEILEILNVVCETHKLPLAQTWVPCRHRSVLAYGGGSKKSCTSFDGSCMGQVCMSTTDVAFYVVDAHMWGFRDACAEHHLQKGQGVAGRAFGSHRPCFCRDITQFSKTEYPLVHYAHMFGLMSSLAIRLQSTYTGSDAYILEFLLPPNCKDNREQLDLVDSLLTTMRQCFRSLKVVSEKELKEERSLEIIETSIIKKPDSKFSLVQSQIYVNHFQSCLDTSTSPGLDDFQNTGDDVIPNLLEQQFMTEVDAQKGLDTSTSPGLDDFQNTGDDVIPNLLEQQFMTEVDAQKDDNKLINAERSQSLPSSNNKSMKTCERRRTKTEKSISLEILQQYFSGSLKDAAKSLGVCPTTMKRICRQHGISRWPSRKINKVNRSLSKLKRVIESVEGAEGTFTLASFTSPLPVAVSSISWPVNKKGLKQQSASIKTSALDGESGGESPTRKTPESDDHGDDGDAIVDGVRLLGHQELIHEQGGSQLEVDKGCSGTKTRTGSGEESTETQTSQESRQGSPTNETNLNFPFVSSLEQGVNINTSVGLACQPTGSFTAAYSIPEALVTTQQQSTLHGMLIEDSGSCQDFKELYSLAVEGCQDDPVPESSWTNPLHSEPPNQQIMPPLTTRPQVMATQEVRTVTIKATYKEDIIRFQLPVSSGVIELKEEVLKRLKLEVSTFDIKYLDDDHEWVLMACDEDLQECLEISKSSGGHVIRLLVHDIIANFGSSCESSGGCEYIV
ncbi:plant regulator RWP-RK family protein [Tasmannia lanceolata]|uniref:plant regulator RWP-RK family protein n=1 Tax=Tasmannia lanceolata TaxID=3420 RepID=UPI004063A409